MSHLSSIDIDAASFPRRDVYPFNLAVLSATARLSLSAPISFFVGENGSGKSTLLRAVAHHAGIHIWNEPERARYRFNPDEETLYRHIELGWTSGPVPGSFFASETFNHFARLLDDWASVDPGVLSYFGSESLVTKSHGQRHLAFFNSRFAVKGLYLLDEPENALSPRSQLRLLSVLTAAAGSGSVQFIIATHSPILLACPGARIYSFDRCPIETVAYEETDHCRIYRAFMADPDRFLSEI